MINLRKKLYITASVSIIITLLFVFGLISPLFSTIKNDSKDLLSQKEKIVSLREKKENFKNLQRAYLDIQANKNKIDSLFVDIKEPINFINFLEKTSETLNLTTQISLNNEEVENKLQPTLSFQIKSTGSFQNFMRFLEKLESSPYLIEIDSLNIKKLSASETQFEIPKQTKAKINNIQATLDIKVYAR